MLKDIEEALKDLYNRGEGFLALVEGELFPSSEIQEDHNYFEFEVALNKAKEVLTRRSKESN